MSYLLSGTSIKAPKTMTEANSTQTAQQRTLNGSVGRDLFGSNKRVWRLNYENMTQTDFTTIQTIYTAYLATGSAVTWQVTETNYAISQTSVHVDLVERNFNDAGADYISSFVLTLTEA